jgi:hypothetical protein
MTGGVSAARATCTETAKTLASKKSLRGALNVLR